MCETLVSPDPFQPFRCGTCSIQEGELDMFHLHLSSHVEGRGFFYDFATKTAHIRFSSVSIGCQTELEYEECSKVALECKYAESDIAIHNMQNEASWQQTDEVLLVEQDHVTDDKTFIEYTRIKPTSVNITEEPNARTRVVSTESFQEDEDMTVIKQEITNVPDSGSDTDSYTPGNDLDIEIKHEQNLETSLPARPRRRHKNNPVKYGTEETCPSKHVNTLSNKKQEVSKSKLTKSKNNLKTEVHSLDDDWMPDIEQRKPKTAKKRAKKNSVQMKKEKTTGDAQTEESKEIMQTKKQKCDKKQQGTVQKRKAESLIAPSRIFDCHLCTEKAKSIRYMFKHIETVHEGMYLFSCKTCYIPFLCADMLKVHAETCTDTNVKSFACIECDNQRLFVSEMRFNEHVKNYHESRNAFKCSICDAEMLSAYHGRKHMIEHNKDSLSCQQCKFTTKSVGKYDIHMTSHSRPTGMFMCILCNRESTDSHKICTHYFRHLDDAGDYVCESCGRCFGNLSILGLHRESCDKRYECNVCGRIFAKACALDDHVLYVHENPSLKPLCDQCGASFFSRKALRDHRRSQHTEDKVIFTCPHCSKVFKIKSHYNRHLLVHNDSYQYSCSYCDKSFRAKWNRNVHERQHTGVKPYTCSKCGTGFAHSAKRKKHETICGKLLQ